MIYAKNSDYHIFQNKEEKILKDRTYKKGFAIFEKDLVHETSSLVDITHKI